MEGKVERTSCKRFDNSATALHAQMRKDIRAGLPF
jgi:hypothetical protein